MAPISRRKFVRTSAGFLAVALAPGLYACTDRRLEETSERVCEFCEYRPGTTVGKVYAVTPENAYYLHTFFDVNPFSPSQRYLALTRFAFQGSKPVLGDLALVSVLDLERRTIRDVYATRAWSYQLGANIEWGPTDRYLYSNDVIDGVAVGIRIDLETGEVLGFSGPKYNLARDASFFVGGRLEYMNATQYGYGIPDAADSGPLTLTPEDRFTEGIWHTDTESRQTRLLVSLAELAEASSEPAYYDDASLYCFHTKINAAGTRIFQVMRAQFADGHGGRNPSLFVLDADGTAIRQIIDRAAWQESGDHDSGANHPSWHPDGDHITLNAVPVELGFRDLRFCSIRHDGSEFRVLSERHLGSGHPSVDPTWSYLISDSYPDEDWVTVQQEGEVGIRLIDLTSDEEELICSVPVDFGISRYDKEATKDGGSQLKLDPHPVWSRDYRKVAFNGVVAGERRVFIADLEGIV